MGTETGTQKESSTTASVPPVIYIRSTVRDIRAPIGFAGDLEAPRGQRGPRSNVALRHPQTIKPAGYLEILWFGKRHYISPALFERDADKYQQLHWKDAFVAPERRQGGRP